MLLGLKEVHRVIILAIGPEWLGEGSRQLYAFSPLWGRKATPKSPLQSFWEVI